MLLCRELLQHGSSLDRNFRVGADLPDAHVSPRSKRSDKNRNLDQLAQELAGMGKKIQAGRNCDQNQ